MQVYLTQALSLLVEGCLQIRDLAALRSQHSSPLQLTEKLHQRASHSLGRVVPVDVAN